MYTQLSLFGLQSIQIQIQILRCRSSERLSLVLGIELDTQRHFVFYPYHPTMLVNNRE